MNNYIKTSIILSYFLMISSNRYSQNTQKIVLGIFTIEVPSELKPLNQEERELKYVLQGQILDIVYQNENDWVNVSYKKTHIPIEDSQFKVF